MAAIRESAASADRHSVAVLEEGATYSQLTAPLADMEFVASQHLSKTTIANIFHLPPAYIGGSTGDSLDVPDDRGEPDPVRPPSRSRRSR